MTDQLEQASPVAAERRMIRQIRSDLRWSFARPWTWLSGVAFNLVLSLLWLIAEPLRGGAHHDWAILVGSYFAVFILADVTTTNVLGADAARVRISLIRQVPLRRILLVKNITLLVVVGLPTLLATALITVASESTYRLEVTLPGVAFPILTWLGVGNLVSVLLPVAATPLRQRWARRRELRNTIRWLAALVLPYGIYLAVDPVGRVPRIIVRALNFLPTETAARGVVVMVTGLVFWGIGTTAALAVARHRKLRFDDAR